MFVKQMAQAALSAGFHRVLRARTAILPTCKFDPLCSVFSPPLPVREMSNAFLTSANKGVTSTENGAKAYRSTGSALADQFSKASTYRGRAFKDVFRDQSVLNGEDKFLGLAFMMYNRMVTRKVNVLGDEPTQTDKVQSGQGQRDESFKRFLWYAQNNPEVFYDNLWFIITVGSFRDMWDIMVMAKEEGIKLDRARMYAIYTELAQHSDLSKKFLPTLRPADKQITKRSKMRNMFGREYRDFLGITNSQYRRLKESGTAHEWQKLIARKEMKALNFGRIPGKALANMTKGKFLQNQGLEKVYLDWLDSQPTAKFTGYVYELYQTYKNAGHAANRVLINTVNKQFDGLIALAKQNEGGINGNVWCALDTSGSMGSPVSGANGLSAFDVCLSLGIYFAALNQGAFHKNVIMFDDKSTVKQLQGNFTDMVSQVPHGSMGGTNFLSVIAEIIRIRQANPGIPLSDYPQTLLVVSDMQFNPAGDGSWNSSFRSSFQSNNMSGRKTNHEAAIERLATVFPQEFVDGFKFIWWDVTSRTTGNVPSTLSDQNTYVFSGFDGSIVTLLLGGEGVKVNGEIKKNPTMEEMIQATLDQEIFSLLTIK